MKTIARLTLAASALLASGALMAQIYKCSDANGKITYSGKKCSDLGLKAVGEVKDQIQTIPAYRPPPGTESARSAPPAPAPAAQAPEPPASAESNGCGPGRHVDNVAVFAR